MNERAERRRLLAYARDAAGILRETLNVVEAGQPAFYRVAAVQLRLLLCDTTRRHGQIVVTSLAARLWPDLRLGALSEALAPPTVPLDDWLAQKLPEGDFTVLQFIRLVCDQDGGAHVDLRQHAGLPEAFPSLTWICRLSEVALTGIDAVLALEN